MKKRIRIQGILIVTAIILIIVLNKFIASPWKKKSLDEFLDISGIILVLSGFLLRIAARGYKEEKSCGGKNMVTDGPYGLMRNPMYFGTLLIGTGVIFVLFELWTVLIFLIIYCSIYVPQVKKEEKVMSERFGEQYRNYCKVTPKYFPNIHYLLNFKGYLSLKFSWIRKELSSSIATISAVLAIEFWEDIRFFGYSGLLREVTELLSVILVFVIVVSVLIKKSQG